MESGTILEITVCEQTLLRQPQMQVKAQSYEEEAIWKHDPEILP